MSSENKEQQVDQLLRGVYRMCVNRDDCSGCPFFITKCSFGEPKPKTWFDEETIEVKTPVEPEKAKEKVYSKYTTEKIWPQLTNIWKDVNNREKINNENIRHNSDIQ